MVVPIPALLLKQEDALHACRLALPVAQAWDIALTWGDALRNHVRLETQRKDEETVLKSYAWVRFSGVHHPDDSSAARCAAIAWFAIACCPGYSGRENPVFWKCVFSELWQEHTALPDRPFHMPGNSDVESIVEADGFFDEDGVEFPRFQLDVEGLALDEYDANVRLFCGVTTELLGQGDAFLLQRVLSLLEPWIEIERCNRCPAVGLVGVPSPNFSKGDRSTGRVLRSLLQNVHDRCTDRATPSTWFTRVFSIQQVVFQSSFAFTSADDVQLFSQSLSDHAIDLGAFRCDVKRTISRDVLAALTKSTRCWRARSRRVGLSAVSVDGSHHRLPQRRCIHQLSAPDVCFRATVHEGCRHSVDLTRAASVGIRTRWERCRVARVRLVPSRYTVIDVESIVAGEDDAHSMELHSVGRHGAWKQLGGSHARQRAHQRRLLSSNIGSQDSGAGSATQRTVAAVEGLSCDHGWSRRHGGGRV